MQPEQQVTSAEEMFEAPSPFPEFESTPLNTTLHLFQYDPERDEAVADQLARADEFRGEVWRLSEMMDELRREKDKAVFHVTPEVDRAVVRVATKVRRKTFGNLYLTMREELLPLKVGERDIYALFKRCIQLSNAYLSGFGDPNPDYIPRLTKALQQETAPEWFWGNKDSWRQFLLKRIAFSNYLEDRGTTTRGISPEVLNEDPDVKNDFLTQLIGPTSTPSWFDKSSDDPPVVDAVKSAYTEDAEALIRESQVFGTAETKRLGIVNIDKVEHKRFVSHMMMRREKVFGEITDLADLVILLHAADGTSTNSVGQSEIDRMSANDLQKRRVGPSEFFENMLKDHLSDPTGRLLKDMFALWFEDQLQRRGIIVTVDDPVTGRIHEVFASLLQSAKGERVVMQNGDANEKKENRANTRIVNDIRPFLRQLTAEDIAELENVLSMSNDKAAEWFVVMLADYVSERVDQSRATGGNKELKSAKADLKRFSMQWVRENWRQAYDMLRKRHAKLAWDKGAIPVFSKHVLAANRQASEIEQSLRRQIDELREYHTPSVAS